MQRVRIGLTGLAFVFMAVLLAAIFTSQSSEEKPITPKLIEQQTGPEADRAAESAAEASQPKEPLAELGVAPGGPATNSSTEKPGEPADSSQ